MTTSTFTRRQITAAAAAASMARALPTRVRAQGQADACPQGRICVEYKDEATIEIDPGLGYLQSICVAVVTITNTTFSGTTTIEHVKMADFVSTGDTYALMQEHVVPREGHFASADLGDVFVLMEVAND